MSDDGSGSRKLVCPKCGDTITVGNGFSDSFYCHSCGVAMVAEK